MLDEGKTLGEINEKLHIWYELPEHLENVNKDSCLSGCHSTPARQIKSINFDGRVHISGYGIWSNYYNEDLYLNTFKALN